MKKRWNKCVMNSHHDSGIICLKILIGIVFKNKTQGTDSKINKLLSDYKMFCFCCFLLNWYLLWWKGTNDCSNFSLLWWLDFGKGLFIKLSYTWYVRAYLISYQWYSLGGWFIVVKVTRDWLINSNVHSITYSGSYISYNNWIS